MYSTQIDGEVLKFGTSGFLYRSNKLMYDRRTDTLWHQFRGEPVIGPLANSGIRLEVLPVTVATWGEWVRAHPETTVLDINTGIYPREAYAPESDPASVYYRYRQQPGTMFPVPQRSDLLPAKAEVLGLRFNGQAKAYPLEVLRQQPVVNDSLGGQDLVIITLGEGGGSRAYQRGDHHFGEATGGTAEAGAVVLRDDKGLNWRMEEDSLVQVEDPSMRLPRLPHHTSYWFGWYAFYPGTAVYG